MNKFKKLTPTHKCNNNINGDTDDKKFEMEL